jgi:hypothetical protein
VSQCVLRVAAFQGSDPQSFSGEVKEHRQWHRSGMAHRSDPLVVWAVVSARCRGNTRPSRSYARTVTCSNDVSPSSIAALTGDRGSTGASAVHAVTSRAVNPVVAVRTRIAPSERCLPLGYNASIPRDDALSIRVKVTILMKSLHLAARRERGSL